MAGTEFGDPAMRERMAEELYERLKEQRSLHVYYGIDPTAPDIHLGHTVPLRKLRQFQELGHHVTFLMGDFTARIGDPSDKDRTRPQLSPEEIAANVRTYTDQAFKILDRERTEIRYNSEWLSELDFADLIRLASNFTVQQFLQRDNFAKRLERGDAIYLHEFFYALMQGYDAVAQHTDVQVGGTDQTFNMLAGRTLQERVGQKPHVALTFGMLPGTDGVQKMSKSLGNAIEIDTTPEDMYGKLMSIPDEAMPIYYRLVTRYHPEEIERSISAIESGAIHPRDAKMKLAYHITAIFHGEEGAKRAEEHFKRVFQQQQLPPDMPERIVDEPIGLLNLIAEADFARGTGAARRLVQQEAVSIDDEKITDPTFTVEPTGEPRVLRVGKRRFLRLLPG
ncbi:MAG: tyrosine--tRNA ligase [Chloroflexota bacterium]|nr:tyrosine--tRNA ligase [Chloroflexota bacterium]